jgi:pyruvyltransferase
MRLIGMKLTGRRNFGDAVNKVFWSKITNKKILKDCSNEHFITTGSIMNLVQPNSIVFGTGFISENGDLGGGNFLSSSNKKNSIPKEVISVRGPRTREKLLSFNIDCPDNFGDPLILLPCIYPVKKNVKNKLVGIIPHYIDKNSKLLNTIKSALKKDGYKVKIISIQVGSDYKSLINQINNCEYIISSSLHGIITGYVYQKKTIYLEFSNKLIGNKFKFYDFFESIKKNYSINNNYTSSILENFIDRNYEELNKISLNLINVCPFIEKGRKEELKIIYKKFYGI